MSAGYLSRILWTALLCLGTFQPLAAEQADARVIKQAEAHRWRGVGSLRVAGRPACTAMLISEREAITAAHCVVDRTTGRRISPHYLVVVFGQRIDGFAAVRKVARAVYLPGFVSSEPITDLAELSTDLALLSLDRPVTLKEAVPLDIAEWPHPVGEFVDVVGYERDGSKSATIREGCVAIEGGPGVTVLTCHLITGISGAPVLLSAHPDDPPRVVAAVSTGGQGKATVVTIAPRLAELRGLIAGKSAELAGAAAPSASLTRPVTR